MFPALVLAAVSSIPMPSVSAPGSVEFDVSRFHVRRADSLALWQRSVHYRNWMQSKRRMGYVMEMTHGQSIELAERIERAWYVLDDAVRLHSGDQRRSDMVLLREILGEEAYAAGWMPPPAPEWFKEEWEYPTAIGAP